MTGSRTATTPMSRSQPSWCQCADTWLRGTGQMADTDLLAAAFEEHRPHLRAVAYRLLGSTTDADDAVQDAWLRLSRADATEVGNLGGWLTTVVARICLDRLRARTARREEPMGIHLPQPIVSSPDVAPDPEQEAILAHSVGLAMLV